LSAFRLLYKYILANSLCHTHAHTQSLYLSLARTHSHTLPLIPFPSFHLCRYMDSEGRVKMLTAAIRAELLATIETMAKVQWGVVQCSVV
jgi:hypothetical protein